MCRHLPSTVYHLVRSRTESGCRNKRTARSICAAANRNLLGIALYQPNRAKWNTKPVSYQLRIRCRVRRCLDLVHLGNVADRPAPMLSGGQQQRLALARALVPEPKLLLLDEPLSNLDARLREEMRFELREITRKSNVTTIFVTHEQTEALSLSDVVFVMNDGRIVERGTPRDLYLSPASTFVATFLGRSNLLPAQIVSVDANGVDVTAALDDPPIVSSALGTMDCILKGTANAGDRVTLVARPDGIILDNPEQDGALPVGIVEGVAFLGDSADCAVRVGDLLLMVKVASDAAPTQGRQVAIRIRPRHCIALGPQNEENHVHSSM
jgi:iron(III) transport system ATP-binding protein